MREAKKRLHLHEIWMLVSPQNPHKSTKDMEDYALRMEQCQILMKNDPYIKVSDFEKNKSVNKTSDTIRLITKQHKNHQFVWLMGCENWQHFHKWHNWQDIMKMIPIASFYREEKPFAALKSPAITRFKSFRCEESSPIGKPPQWRVLFMRPHAGRATNIRDTLKKGESPEHLTAEQLHCIQKRHSFCVGT
ncbi:MAG: nicotinate-nucleotide adenylyltransferase [Alphaproteobacteria bacterium]|jgi:nicotinate-nucleotide adenylyltransferase